DDRQIVLGVREIFLCEASHRPIAIATDDREPQQWPCETSRSGQLRRGIVRIGRIRNEIFLRSTLFARRTRCKGRKTEHGVINADACARIEKAISMRGRSLL